MIMYFLCDETRAVKTHFKKLGFLGFLKNLKS